MEKYLKVLADSPLFTEITEDELNTLLSCLGAVKKYFKKGECIFMTGDVISSVGVVLEGNIQIIKEDYFGNRHVIANISEGDYFSESLACARSRVSPVTAIAVTDCTVMALKFSKIVGSCPSGCTFHNTLIKNMLKILAEKNLILNTKLDLLSSRTIRDKLLAFLSEQSGGKSTFNIPFNRNELADYICADRSAVSRELSKMKAEGIINYDKSRFTII